VEFFRKDKSVVWVSLNVRMFVTQRERSLTWKYRQRHHRGGKVLRPGSISSGNGARENAKLFAMISAMEEGIVFAIAAT